MKPRSGGVLFFSLMALCDNTRMEQQLISFLGELAKAMHVSGANSHDLERHVHQIGRRFGVEAHCFALPTMLTITLETAAEGQQSKLVRLPAYDYNMVRLIALKDLNRKLYSLSQLDEAQRQLAHIMHTPSPWKPWQMVVCGFVLSSSIALLLGGAGSGKSNCIRAFERLTPPSTTIAPVGPTVSATSAIRPASPSTTERTMSSLVVPSDSPARSPRVSGSFHGEPRPASASSARLASSRCSRCQAARSGVLLTSPSLCDGAAATARRSR